MKICQFVCFLLLGSIAHAAERQCNGTLDNADRAGIEHFYLTQKPGEQFAFLKFPPGIEKAILDAYNHTAQGCSAPADNLIAAYSKYADGYIVYRCGKHYVIDHAVDRALLRDALDGKTAVVPNIPRLAQCPPNEPAVRFEAPATRTP